MTEEPVIYAVWLSVQAQQDVFEASFRLAELTQELSLAKQWADRLYREVGRLAANPRGYVVAERESRLLGREIRQMVYRRSSSSMAYRILFVISEDTDEGPTVTIVYVRHGGRKPITRKEALQILINQ